MIDVVDDLKLAQSHLKDQGLEMVVTKFLNILKAEGLTEIKAENEEFDPETMECVHCENGEENKVLSVKKTGFKLNDQVIRPAQVIVGKKEIIN
jgi:molecular chaperone GrpE